MRRATLLAIAVVFGAACGGSTKPPPNPSPSAPAAVVESEPASSAPPAPVDPWPVTKPGAAWTVVEWDMTDRDAAEALRASGLAPEPSTDPKTGRVEALNVPGAASGWKASLTFDAETNKLAKIIVRGDPVSLEAARAERARLEERFGAPRETRARASKHYGERAIEIAGPLPSWRFTQSLTRAGEATGPVDWPALELSWGMSLAAAKSAMKRAGFKPEKLPKPEKVSTSTKKKKNAGKKKQATPDPGLPPDAPRGSKLVELGFKKDGEHVQLSLVDKTGLFKVSVGQDVPDRKTAERLARDVSSGLGAVLSEAETEATSFRDAATDVQLTITGFQGQRIVFESYERAAQP